MTTNELKERIVRNMGEKHISECAGRIYVNFDKNDDLNFQILPNFKLGELLTKNKTDTFTKLELGVLVLLQTIREKFGHSVAVSSSYRSKTYNNSVNGATSSEHLRGHAIDSHPVDVKLIGEYKTVIRNMNIKGGVGEYPSFVHVDTRNNRARWDG